MVAPKHCTLDLGSGVPVGPAVPREAGAREAQVWGAAVTTSACCMKETGVCGGAARRHQNGNLMSLELKSKRKRD